MQLNRFYYSTKYEINKELTLPDDICHKIINVLRLKIGNEILLFNGKNIEASSKIISISKKNIVIKIISVIEKNIESPIKIHLAQAISKINKMDFIIQKATELGVYDITPIVTERTIGKVHKDKEDNKILHWQKVAISACEQCERNFIPTIHKPEKFENWVKNSVQENDLFDANSLTLNASADISTVSFTDDATILKIILEPKANLTPSLHLQNIYSNRNICKDIFLLIGPEGGFTQKEIELAKV